MKCTKCKKQLTDKEHSGLLSTNKCFICYRFVEVDDHVNEGLTNK